MTDTTNIVPWYEMEHGIERELAKYDQCEEPGDCDHDHDNAIEYMREAELNELRAERDAAVACAEAAESERDGAYRERAHLLALLALTYPALITEAADIPCDHADCDGRHWHLLFLQIDGHQAAWHIAPADMGLWPHVPYVAPDDPRAQWDGHTTEQKYGRILEYVAAHADAVDAKDAADA